MPSFFTYLFIRTKGARLKSLQATRYTAVGALQTNHASNSSLPLPATTVVLQSSSHLPHPLTGTTGSTRVPVVYTHTLGTSMLDRCFGVRVHLLLEFCSLTLGGKTCVPCATPCCMMALSLEWMGLNGIPVSLLLQALDSICSRGLGSPAVASCESARVRYGL